MGACVFSASRSTMERNAAVRTRRHLWPDGRTDGSLFETEKETERERDEERESEIRSFCLSRSLSLPLFYSVFRVLFSLFLLLFFNFSYTFSLEMMIYFSCLERSRLKNRNEC